MIHFIYSENMFILYNFLVLYYAIYLKFNHNLTSMNRIDKLIVNMTIIGTCFNIISFIFSNYVFIEISHVILAFQVLLGSVLYSSRMLSYSYIITIMYLLIVRIKYRKCPYYLFNEEIKDDILLTSYEFNNMCFILALTMVLAKKLGNIET
mgnify:FL=1